MKPPKYKPIKRLLIKVGRIFTNVPHSYLFKLHPERSKKNGRDDYAYCENCKKWAWEIDKIC